MNHATSFRLSAAAKRHLRIMAAEDGVSMREMLDTIIAAAWAGRQVEA